MSEELVTVIMPVYNATRFLAMAIESVLEQTYVNLELIIIDDCSKDNSLDIAKEYASKDKRVKVIASKENKGVAFSRNIGIKSANGNFIALLDSDDIWTKNKIEKQLELLKEKKAQIAYCSYDFIDEYSNSILKPFIVPTQTNFKQMLYGNVIGCSTVLVQADILKKHLFKAEFYHEDYALWMEILQENIKAVGLTSVYVHYRKVSGSRSDNKINAAKQRWKIFREELELPFWKCIVAFIGYAVNGIIKHYLKY